MDKVALAIIENINKNSEFKNFTDQRRHTLLFPIDEIKACYD